MDSRLFVYLFEKKFFTKNSKLRFLRIRRKLKKFKKLNKFKKYPRYKKHPRGFKRYARSFKAHKRNASAIPFRFSKNIYNHQRILRGRRHIEFLKIRDANFYTAAYHQKSYIYTRKTPKMQFLQLFKNISLKKKKKSI